MDALVLAAGFGTRLGTRPKAFLPVGGSTAIDRLLDAAHQAGIARVVVVHNDLWAVAFSRWARMRTAPPEIERMNDGAREVEERLGAVGDLKLGLRALSGDVVLLPVDNVMTWPLKRFTDRAVGHDPALSLRTMRAGYEGLGAVDMDPQGVVRNIYDRPRPGGGRAWARAVWLGPAFMPMGLGALAAEYEAEERASGRRPDRLGEFFGWLARRLTVRGHVVDDGDAWDVGTPRGLADAQRVLGS